MLRLVQGVLAFLSFAMSLAVWNNKAKSRYVYAAREHQKVHVMSLYGKKEVGTVICSPMG